MRGTGIKSDGLQSIRMEHVRGRHGNFNSFGPVPLVPEKCMRTKIRTSEQQNTVQEDLWLKIKKTNFYMTTIMTE
jgi:hypothetical protein